MKHKLASLCLLALLGTFKVNYPRGQLVFLRSDSETNEGVFLTLEPDLDEEFSLVAFDLLDKSQETIQFNPNKLENRELAFDLPDFEAYDSPLPSVFSNKAKAVLQAVSEFRVIDSICKRIGKYDVCPEGTYKIALCLTLIQQDTFLREMTADYHFYRQDQSGNWSHKPGLAAVTDSDSSGEPISDVDKCNRGSYVVFHDYYATTPWGGHYETL